MSVAAEEELGDLTTVLFTSAKSLVRKQPREAAVKVGLLRPLSFLEVDALYRALAIVDLVVVFGELAQDEAAV